MRAAVESATLANKKILATCIGDLRRCAGVDASSKVTGMYTEIASTASRRWVDGKIERKDSAVEAEGVTLWQIVCLCCFLIV